jgi:hypothetical protein
MGEARNVYRILVGESLGKRPIVRPRRWEDDVKLDLRQTHYLMESGWN